MKIGLVAPFEGRYRYVGYDVFYAVRQAVREANAAGGVRGYSVELVAYDDGADLAMAVEQAQKLAVDPDVVAAIGHFRDQTTLAALETYAEAGTPLLAAGVLDSRATQGDGQVFRLYPTDAELAEPLLGYVGEELGLDRVALVSDGGPLSAALRERAPSLVADVSPHDAGWLEEVIPAGAVLCDADPVTAAEVVTALREAGWAGAFLGGPEMGARDFAAVAGAAGEGAFFVTPTPLPRDLARGEEFAAAYLKVSDGLEPGPLAALAYDATRVLLQALERDIAAHGEPTREGMVAALPTVQHAGLLGRIEFDSNHNWGNAPLYWCRVSIEGEPECSLR